MLKLLKSCIDQRELSNNNGSRNSMTVLETILCGSCDEEMGGGRTRDVC